MRGAKGLSGVVGVTGEVFFLGLGGSGRQWQYV